MRNIFRNKILKKKLILLITTIVFLFLCFKIDKEYNLYNQDYKQYADYFNQVSAGGIKHLDNVALVSYATGKTIYYTDRTVLNISAIDHGITRIFNYSSRDLDSIFYQKNKHILSQKRFAGYSLWRQYIILDAMERMPDNSIIFYSDADSYIINDISPLINLAEKYNRVLFKNFHTNLPYTKRDCYILMDADNEESYNMTQLESGFLILKNNQSNRDFIQKWLDYAYDERILTDIPSTLGSEFPSFKGHRHEQSILTLLSTHYSDQVLVEHEDRKKFLLTRFSSRNAEITDKIKQYLRDFFNPIGKLPNYQTKELRLLQN